MNIEKPKLVKISSKIESSTAWSPSDALENAIEDIKNGKKKPTDSVVLLLDRKDGKYSMNWYVAGLSASEVVALLEVAKQDFLKQMGY